MAAVRHPWYFETDSPLDALAGRPLLERYLSDHAHEGSDLFPASVVYGELVSNVVKHAPRGFVRVWLEAQGEYYALCINDAGEGFSQEDIDRGPSAEAESGRGLFIVKQICDELSYGRKPNDGFVVRAVLPIRRRS